MSCHDAPPPTRSTEYPIKLMRATVIIGPHDSPVSRGLTVRNDGQHPPGGATMRVFVIGASSHIGSAFVPELLGAGHGVIALALSDASEEKLHPAGIEVRRGDLGHLDVIRKAATDTDGVNHLAHRSDLASSGDAAGMAAAYWKVMETVGAALEGTCKPFVTRSGCRVSDPVTC